MVYIYPKDWSCENWGVGEDGSYFECDDLIAPTIIELNKKGYITTECCSGHPYREVIVDGAYIAFSKNYEFEKIPKDFIMEDNVLSETYDNNEPRSGWKGIEEIVQVNKMLYEWARDLPRLI